MEREVGAILVSHPIHCWCAMFVATFFVARCSFFVFLLRIKWVISTPIEIEVSEEKTKYAKTIAKKSALMHCTYGAVVVGHGGNRK